MAVKKTFKCLTAVVLKRTNCRQVQWFCCCCCLASAEAQLVAPDVPAVRWQLEDNELVLWLLLGSAEKVR